MNASVIRLSLKRDKNIEKKKGGRCWVLREKKKKEKADSDLWFPQARVIKQKLKKACRNNGKPLKNRFVLYRTHWGCYILLPLGGSLSKMVRQEFIRLVSEKVEVLS
jgi:hypothetical protein